MRIRTHQMNTLSHQLPGGVFLCGIWTRDVDSKDYIPRADGKISIAEEGAPAGRFIPSTTSASYTSPVKILTDGLESRSRSLRS